MRNFNIFLISLFLSLPAMGAEIQDELSKIEAMVQISEMYGRDQGIRQAWFYLHGKGFTLQQINDDPALKARVLEIDKANSAALRKLVEQHGWPGLKNFSRVTDRQAWIIVQHADHDPAFQEDMLRLLRDEAQKKNTNPANFAYLFDRVNVNKGKEQVYGTQGGCVDKGKWEPKPIKDAAKVDAYRKSVELPPMEEFKLRMNASCV